MTLKKAFYIVLVGLPLVVSAQDKPNFIVILTDDLGYNDFGCYGAKDVATPQIDQMADEGTHFTDFYVTRVCSPTRAALLTGCYAQRVDINGVLFPRNTVGLNPEEQTIAELLKEQGYATALIGKWHLGFQKTQTPPNQGFDYWYGTLSSNSSPLKPEEQIYEYAKDCVFREGFTPESVKKSQVGCPLLRDNKIIEIPADQTLFTRRYTEETIKFIKENKDKPFFIYLAHNMPHIPLHVSKPFEGTSNRGLYGDVIQELDWGIGEVLKALKEQGLDEKTMVILTSDNGPKLSAGGSAKPLRGEKGDCFEGGVRVPCIMRWPGKIPSGRTNNEIIAVMDILPTVVTLAGGTVPTERVSDGKDIWPLVSGTRGAKSPHEAFYYLAGRSMKGVRVGDWKYLRDEVKDSSSKVEVELTPAEKKLPRDQRKALVKQRKRAQKQGKGEVEMLFNLRDDIGEKNNLINANPEIAQRLKQMMDAFYKDLRANKRPAGGIAEE